jgi:hypothetical protein
MRTTLFLIIFFSFNLVFAQKNPPYLYYLKIDCAGSDLEHTGTKDPIIVKFYKSNHELIKSIRLEGLTDGDCNSNALEDADFALSHPNMSDGGYGKLYRIFSGINYRISYFTVEIEGDNAFWIDQIFIFRWDEWKVYTLLSTDNPDKTYRWGRTNGNGWCLSTDPGDSNGGFKNNIGKGGCSPCFKFVLRDLKAYRCD